MIEKVKQFIYTNQLITGQTKHVFAAVSGGVDSTVMLNILHQLMSEWGYQLHIVHFNHRTRGKASDADERFVEQLAENFKLDVKIGYMSSTVNGISETALRGERYKFFGRILSRYKNAVVATGHNRDDNIETFLMRLAKGSRLNGLLAIKPLRKGFIRPMLNLSRKEIEGFAAVHKIKFRNDESNQDISIQRNAIRHKIIPYLKNNLNTQFEENIDRVIKDLYLYHDIYENKLREAIISSTKKTKTGISLNRKRYQYFNKAIRRGLIEYCISNNYPLNYKVSDKNYQIWDNFILQSQTGKRNSYLENGTAIAERNLILFGKIPQRSIKNYPLSVGQTIVVDDKYEISLNKIKRGHVSFKNDRNTEIIDGDKCGDNLVVRYWQKGDRFRPLGMKNHRKLSDFFIDLKLSTTRKREVPLVCNQEQIIWIAGYRLDDRYKITDRTTKFYKLELIKKHDVDQGQSRKTFG
jgi:tRNA(Ile)-lysidine synthase